MPKGEGAQEASKKAKAIQKAASPNGREDRAKPKKIVPKSDTVQAAIKASNDKKTANKYKEAGPAFRGAGSNFYTPPAKKPTTGGGGGGGGGGPKEVTPTPPETVVPSSGLVDGVNYKDLYLAEIKRLVLSLANNAKALLIRYNFSGIDRVPEYYLDSDREAKSEAVASIRSVPQTPFTLAEASLQDRFALDINEINNRISDLSDTYTDEFGNIIRKTDFFGSMRGGTFLPREVKVFADGRTGYDMRLTFTSISGQDFIIKCYEVS